MGISHAYFADVFYIVFNGRKFSYSIFYSGDIHWSTLHYGIKPLTLNIIISHYRTKKMVSTGTWVTEYFMISVIRSEVVSTQCLLQLSWLLSNKFTGKP